MREILWKLRIRWVTAASIPENEKYGYVFDRCIFRRECGKSGIYLGRLWRDYARTVIMNSYIGSHIHEKGWHDWDKKSAGEKAFCAEYRNSGPGQISAAGRSGEGVLRMKKRRPIPGRQCLG